MISLFKKRAPILSFGIFQIFFTAPGQTFLISLFIGPMFNELGLSTSMFAGIYSLATLCASLFLQPCGRLLDRYPIKPILLTMISLMMIGCLLIASSSSILSLFFGFFIVRFIGQGAFGLAASTLVTKQFHKNRGKALSIIMFGFPLSEIIYPFIAIFLLESLGWREAYLLFACSFLLMIPIQLYFINRAQLTVGEFYPEETLIQAQRLTGSDAEVIPIRHYTLKETLRDISFYLVLIASTLPPVVMTGLFFHQSTLFEIQNWPIGYAAYGLMAYAIVKAIGSIFIGPLIDTFGSGSFFTLMLALMGVGTYLAGLGGPWWMILVYLSCLGFALGISAPVMNHLWASLYGTNHIGSIKGFISTFRNGLTGFGPLPLAMAMEKGFPLPLLLQYVAIAIFVLMMIPVGLQLFDKRLSSQT